MKTGLLLLASVVITIIGVLWVTGRPAAVTRVDLRLSSTPFPLTVGPTTLLVSLSDSAGAPLDGAVLQVSSQITQGGVLTLLSQPVTSSDGYYQVPVTFPRMGRWTLDVFAQLPDQPNPIQEQFVVFVYPVTPFIQSSQNTYRSVSEINAAVAANPARELWIVIPPGTDEMLMEGLSGDIIPEEILLQVSGQNTLVIRNDDFANHTIGPFFVRAGETIRQVFTQPAIYQGTCTIRHSAEISIIVEA